MDISEDSLDEHVITSDTNNRLIYFCLIQFVLCYILVICKMQLSSILKNSKTVRKKCLCSTCKGAARKICAAPLQVLHKHFINIKILMLCKLK